MGCQLGHGADINNSLPDPSCNNYRSRHSRLRSAHKAPATYQHLHSFTQSLAMHFAALIALPALVAAVAIPDVSFTQTAPDPNTVRIRDVS